jgi:hypothetical protein
MSINNGALIMIAAFLLRLRTYAVEAMSKIAPVHVMGACKGRRVKLHPFLTLTLDGSEWTASRLIRLIASERTPVPIEHEDG